MIIKLERVKLQTRKSEEAVNITSVVDDIVAKSGVRNGLVNVMNTHTSAGLLVTEGHSVPRGRYPDALLAALPRT